MKVVLYYHLYMTDDYSAWSSIFIEHMKGLEDSGILDVIDQMNFTVITNTEKKANVFVGLQGTYDTGKPKYVEFVLNPYKDDIEMVNSIDSQKTITENHTMRKIWNDCQQSEMIVLYLHSKGVTSIKRSLENGDSDTFKKYHYWRQFLNWGVIEKGERCYAAIKHGNYDIAGVNYRETPSKHFSGNFWWAKSEYIKRLPDPSTTAWWQELKSKSSDPWLRSAGDRFRDEQWPCSLEGAKIFNVYSPHDEYGYGPDSRVLKRSQYENK